MAVLAMLAVAITLLLPMAALADTAPESTVEADLVWGDGINGNFAHNTWYSADRHWVMYTEDDDVICSSTTDYGATWYSFNVTSGTQSIFRNLAVWYDEGTNLVHYARVEQRPGNTTDGDIIYHRAGTPLTAGTINWIEAEVGIEEGASNALIGTITIACDRSGFPYIAWTEDEYDMGNSTGHYWVEVSDSDTNDGTWVEDNAYAWEEFEAAEVPYYGHDYDALYGDGNWTAVAVNLVPIEGAGSNKMHLSWSMEEMNGTHTAGIDATIYDSIAGWGNLTWVVPPDITNGLYPDVRGEIAFSAYNSDTSIYFVYADWIGALLYQEKSGAESWDEINGIGNWTTIMPTGGYNYPAIAGYAADGAGDSLIVVYHDGGSLYYDTKPYGPGGFTGTWTEIWGIPGGPDGDFMFLHSLQYKYGADSPVGFAWDWGTLEWGNGTYTGTLDYWWIDQDGVTAGENVLGYYSGGVIASTWVSVLLKVLLDIAIACGLILGVFKFEMGWQAKLSMIVLGLVLIAIVNSLL